MPRSPEPADRSMPASGPGEIELVATEGGARLCVRGEWTLAHHATLAERVRALSAQAGAGEAAAVDVDGLAALDTAGARLLHALLGAERIAALLADETALPRERRALLKAVADALAEPPVPVVGAQGSALGDVLADTGEAMVAFWRHLAGITGFIGLILETALRVAVQPRRWRMTSLVANLERTGLDAVPIIALLTFLIGAVVAFLGATVLQNFGASIFTVELVGYSFLREFGVLLTAILVAGRSGSAFTAQIGSMKVREEIDAIRALGLDPVDVLVVPRIIGLLVALPILTLLAMLAGIVGGALVCVAALDISPAMFITRLHETASVRHFWVGMSKAPVFAFLIGAIGCLEGFKVGGSAASVGRHTTSSVVQAIFVVILVDALAAIFFMELGL